MGEIFIKPSGFRLINLYKQHFIIYAHFFSMTNYYKQILNTHLTQNEQNEEVRDFEKSINSKRAAIFY
jgi:hypothetical protein